MHKLRKVYSRTIEIEESCYHNSTQTFKVSLSYLKCDSCPFVTEETRGDFSHQNIRDAEIDHKFDVLFRLLNR